MQTGEIAAPEVTESSGVAVGRRTDVLWTHNDSGGRARLFLFRRDGSRVGTVNLKGVRAVDWEDLSIGPCSPDRARSCVYVGDFGDNERRRESVAIHKFEEPRLPESRPVDVVVDEVRTIRFRYDGGPINVETLLLEPQTAALYVLEKSRPESAALYEIPNRQTGRDGLHRVDPVGSVSLEHPLAFGRTATGGAVSSDGRTVAIRSYLRIFTFCRDPGEPLPEALARPPTAVPSPTLKQPEALAFEPTGDRLWLTSEKRPAPVVRLDRAGDERRDGGGSSSGRTGRRTDGSAGGCAGPSGARGALFVAMIWLSRRRR